MTATHPHAGHFALTPAHLSWRSARRLPSVRAAAATIGAVVLVIALAVVGIAVLTTGAPDGTQPWPVPRNHEPSPSARTLH